MKTTLYFQEQVLRKRSYLKLSWIRKALKQPEHKETQPDARIRYYVYIKELGTYLPVITLSDGETVHNAFPDQNFKKEQI